MPKLDDVFGLYTKMLLGMGIVFQMPTVVFFLAKMRLVTARFLLKHFKYALLIIFIAAAVITPTGDLMTQTIFAAPMVGALLSQHRHRVGRRTQADRGLPDDDSDPPLTTSRLRFRTWPSRPLPPDRSTRSSRTSRRRMRGQARGGVARLTVMGARAVERLSPRWPRQPPRAAARRAAAFRALEAIADPRGARHRRCAPLADADQSRRDRRDRRRARCSSGARAAAAAVDRLTAVALDRRRPEPRPSRGAAGAARSRGRRRSRRCWSRCRPIPSQAIRGAAAAPPHSALTERDPLDAIAQRRERGTAGRSGRDPRWPSCRPAAIAPLPHLLKIVERVREREGSPAAGRRGDEWTAVRAAAHVALAERGSRLGALRPAGVARAVARRRCRSNS